MSLGQWVRAHPSLLAHRKQKQSDLFLVSLYEVCNRRGEKGKISAWSNPQTLRRPWQGSYKSLSFASEDIQPSGDSAWRVSGKLRLHGESRLIHLSARKLDGRYVGATTIKQTDYGIQPIRAVGGAVRVKNELRSIS
jgi:hypothetical protein